MTNDEILDRADLIFASGIENLKLYYMIGLPTETDDDIESIRTLTLAMRDRMLTHGRPARSARPHRRQRESAHPQTGHGLSVAAHGSDRGDRPQGEATAAADGRDRQRLLHDQVGAAFVLPGPALARRSTGRTCHRGRRAQRWTVASGRRRNRDRRGLLHLPRPSRGRPTALEHHRRRLEAGFFRSEFDKAMRAEWTLPPKRARENAACCSASCNLRWHVLLAAPTRSGQFFPLVVIHPGRFAAGAALVLALSTSAVAVRSNAWSAGGVESRRDMQPGRAVAVRAPDDHPPTGHRGAVARGVLTFAPLGYRPAEPRRPWCPPIRPGLPIRSRSCKLFGRRASTWSCRRSPGSRCGSRSAWVVGSGGPATGLVAAIGLATSPIFLRQSTQLMSDVPAAAWWMAALALGYRGTGAAAVGAGVMSTAAVLTRPNLVPAGAVGAALVVSSARNESSGDVPADSRCPPPAWGMAARVAPRVHARLPGGRRHSTARSTVRR